ncbi:MAG: helix-turn-helix domain-containing protein [Cyanobacteria bacterium P01_A01_bin.83]
MSSSNSFQPIVVNLTIPQSRSQLKGQEPLISSQNLGWKYVNFDYYRYGNCETPVHVLEHHAIGLILDRGHVKRKLDGRYRLERTARGSVTVIPAQVEHWSAWECVGSFIMFSILPKAIAEIDPETVDPDRVVLIPRFAAPEPDPLIYGIGLAIKDYLTANPSGYGLYIEHLNHALAAHLLQNYCNVQPVFREYAGGLSLSKLKSVTDYINDNLDKNIKLAELARLVDLSQYYFGRLFLEATGISPYRYIIEQRVEKVKRLLRYSQLTLRDIAHICGFSSQSQMTQHFRKQTGITPKKYRDAQK